LQRFALLFGILLLVLSLPGTGWAKSDSNLYEVHGIDVDATADNASAARDKAIAEGAQKGLEQLLKDLTAGDDSRILPTVTEKSAGALVQDFSVESERASGTRYIARLSFRFKADGVRALLASGGAHYVDAKAGLTLVVPVYRSASGDLVWQPDNPWRAAWKNTPTQSTLVPVIVPDGSADDAQTFAAADLQNQDKLAALAQHYKADNAVVVIATATSPTGDPQQGLQITLTNGGGTPEDFHSAGGATPAEALANGVTATLGTLDQAWKQHVLKGTPGPIAFKTAPLPSGGDASTAVVSGNQFALKATLTGPADWSTIRTKLSQIDGIQRVILRSLSLDSAIVVVSVAGDDQQLAQLLASKGLGLGQPEAVPVGDGELATIVPASGPGAGYIYPIFTKGTP
jgi:hypothetical protein